MPEKEEIVGATHNFHCSEYARFWADRFKLGGARLECFEHIGDLLMPKLKESSLVLELGTGPGYLAGYLLKRFSGVRYDCLDFSDAMLKIAQENLAEYSSRTRFQRVDLLEERWERQIESRPSAIVSTWALHDLESKVRVAAVYRSARKLLSKEGILINADFIKPAGINREFEGGRFLIAEHLDYLKDAGFRKIECTREFERNLDQPASHHNYACIQGEV